MLRLSLDEQLGTVSLPGQQEEHGPEALPCMGGDWWLVDSI